jgi:hypothetical protein
MTDEAARGARPHQILPDPYWANMIVGRLVHQHLTFVEKFLFAAHRDVEQALLANDRSAVHTVSRLDGTRPLDRVRSRLWKCVLGRPLPETIMVPERFVPRELPGLPGQPGVSVLIFGDTAGAVADGLTRAVFEIDTHALGQVVRLGLGLVGTESLPDEFRSACARECALLPTTAWTGPTREIAELVLAAAACSLALLWADAETRAYELREVPTAAAALADDFATGVVAELRRRRSAVAGETTRPTEPVPSQRAPTQERLLPLVSELVRCWWPAWGRARHIFGSRFDYMSTLEIHDAHR